MGRNIYRQVVCFLVVAVILLLLMTLYQLQYFVALNYVKWRLYVTGCDQGETDLCAEESQKLLFP